MKADETGKDEHKREKKWKRPGLKTAGESSAKSQAEERDPPTGKEHEGLEGGLRVNSSHTADTAGVR